MTTEKMQELSKLTEIAVLQNDIETLKQIKSIIDFDNDVSEILSDEGDEWFYSLLTGEQISKI